MQMSKPQKTSRYLGVEQLSGQVATSKLRTRRWPVGATLTKDAPIAIAAAPGVPNSRRGTWQKPKALGAIVLASLCDILYAKKKVQTVLKKNSSDIHCTQDPTQMGLTFRFHLFPIQNEPRIACLSR